MARKRTKRRWIQKALRKRKRGALHRQLGVPIGTKIPYKMLRRAAKKSGLLGSRARLALRLRRMRRRGKRR